MMEIMADSHQERVNAQSNDIVWHRHSGDQASRALLKNQQPLLLWFTGG
jgi:hypothetical protein